MLSIAELKKEALKKLEGVSSPGALEALRREYLGRKGKLSLFLRGLSALPLAKRRGVGGEGNELRRLLESAIAEKSARLDSLPQRSGSREFFDVSRPGKRPARGHIHVLSQTFTAIREIFSRMGFSAVDGPEVESEWYNFDAVNMPKDHPARDMQDTFWLRQPLGEGSKPLDAKHRLLLRTQLSGIQVRYLEKHPPPFRIYYEGRAFRPEATDATHGLQFHQMEVLYVDRHLSVANFKAIIEQFLREFFRKDLGVRLRPAYFPFVEPGFEIDMTCVRCGGKRCTLCATGWVEIAGAGMVHPNVFRAAGCAPHEWTGIAFAFGIDRLAMLKHRIPDIRMFFEGDLRFIEQF